LLVSFTIDYMKSSAITFCTAFIFALLYGCGGGSDSTTPASITPAPVPNSVSNAVPVANAGVDQTVPVGATATLEGGASADANGDALTYAWQLTLKPAGSTASLSANSASRPQISLDVEGIYTASLNVSDGKSTSATDTVSIVAVKAAIVTTMPVANAGVNQSVLTGATVALDGTASNAMNGKGLTYRWMFIVKPAGNAVLSSTTVSKPTFVADTAGAYTVGLVVNNGVNDSLMASSIITATAPASVANIAPVANAGADQRVVTGGTVSLDGSLSNDVNGDRLNYLWTLLTKPDLSSAVLSTASQVSPSFRADLSGVYEVRLSVNNGKLDSVAGDLITIVAAPANATVIADTGTYRCASLSNAQATALYAAGHTYLDRDHDGKPCEANDLLNELASPYVAPAPATSGKCWVNGYRRKNGTYVNGYYRSC
jgi:hypothetical protein